MVAVGASTVLAAGSKPWGSPIRSTRETASLGTIPAYASVRAADGDPVQRRETFSSKEIQVAQIKDQSAAPHQMPQGVLGQSVSVGCIDVPVGADDGYR
jgi:hypothetical protein